MSNCFEFELDNLVYEEYSQEEIINFEDIGHSFFKGVKEVKNKIGSIIRGENIREIKKYVYEELEIGENILSEFRGNMDGVQYLDMMYSAETGLLPMATYDIGSRYYCFLTDKKLLAYEIGYFNKIMREYVIDNKDIGRVNVDEKDNHITFYVKKDKYDSTRTSMSFIFYYIMQGRVGMYITSDNKEEVYSRFKENYKQAKWSKVAWILCFIAFLIFICL